MKVRLFFNPTEEPKCGEGTVFNGVENTEEEVGLSNGGTEMRVNGVIVSRVCGERVKSETWFEEKGYGFREEGCRSSE